MMLQCQVNVFRVMRNLQAFDFVHIQWRRDAESNRAGRIRKRFAVFEINNLRHRYRLRYRLR